jgi:hypothetical protein
MNGFFDTAAWGAVLLMPAAVFAFEFWQGSVRPRLIPRANIAAEAEALAALHGAAAHDVAKMEEFRAWRDGNSLAQGRWRLVRKAAEGDPISPSATSPHTRWRRPARQPLRQ